MSAIAELALAASTCERCELAKTRTQVVFGVGDPNADLMLVGEAPGAREDELGRPFVGASGRFLDQLLASIDRERDDVYITNVLLCRPPGNRDPKPEEITACGNYLFRQIVLVRPHVIATLGGFATKLLRAEPHGIARCHGQEEEKRFGARVVWLYPLYHPALALYTPSMRPVLLRDFARIPELLQRDLEQPEPEPGEETPVEQLGLFTTGRWAEAVS